MITKVVRDGLGSYPLRVSAAARLEIQALCVAYPRGLVGSTRVLHGVDLTLQHGRFLGLAGPNGSGKSTLLRAIAGLEPVESGVLRVLGGSPGSGAVQRRTGYLSEDTPFPPELRLSSMLRMLGELAGLERAGLDARVAQRLSEVGLAQHAEQRIGRCSRGMLRRFGLAQAWLADPELILLDEPTAGLDAEGFDVLARLLARARTQSVSVVLASHLPGDLLQHCDELAIMLDGRITTVRPPRELIPEGGLLEVYRQARERA
jgi:ABC-type multidrug transport system ATPase subunit